MSNITPDDMRPGLANVVGDHSNRIRILESLPPPIFSSSYAIGSTGPTINGSTGTAYNTTPNWGQAYCSATDTSVFSWDGTLHGVHIAGSAPGTYLVATHMVITGVGPPKMMAIYPALPGINSYVTSQDFAWGVISPSAYVAAVITANTYQAWGMGILVTRASWNGGTIKSTFACDNSATSGWSGAIKAQIWRLSSSSVGELVAL